MEVGGRKQGCDGIMEWIGNSGVVGWARIGKVDGVE